MGTHYLKVAFRNLLRYRTQSLVSLLGLALAFACVSLAVYWNHYERTFDAFQRNADRIYRIRSIAKHNGKVDSYVSNQMYYRLTNEYPEVEAVSAIGYAFSENATLEGNPLPDDLEFLTVSPETFDMFGIEWVTGDRNVGAWGENQIAISEELAKYACGTESPIGKKIVTQEFRTHEYEVVGVYKTWPTHSNLEFDMIGVRKDLKESGFSRVYVMLKEGVEHAHFIHKLRTDTIAVRGNKVVYDIITPLKNLHFTYPEKQTNVRMSDVSLFTGAAALLAMCALLNYLILFVSRLRGRGRDMALRTICGSSGWQINRLLMTEYLLLLLLSLLLGLVLVELCMNKFVELSMVEVERSAVFMACGGLLLFVVLLAWLLSVVPIYYFKRKTLRVQIESTPTRLGKNYFRVTGVCVQLMVGLLFMFCSTVMMKQIYFLLHADINIAREQRGWVHSSVGSERLMDVLRQIPCIEEMIPVQANLYPLSVSSMYSMINGWDGKPAEAASISYRCEYLNESIAKFYDLKMKEGATSFDLEKNEIFINEALVKAMGMENPVGKNVFCIGMSYKIKGVICNYQSQSPTEAPFPTLFMRSDLTQYYTVAFKYTGSWKACKEALTKALDSAELPLPKVGDVYRFYDGEEVYKKYVKSEYNLLKLLGTITVISVVIALFGIYALVVQSCEQHRKEIAIRKVNGARVKDILLMFFKQYMLQVVVAAVIAFPVGYVLMKRWLESYSRQIEIGFWLFAGIFVVTALLVTICIGWHVWRAANENPARVIKKE